jgi:hypothetical protein
MTDTVVRENGEDIVASVRTIDGIFDTERRDGLWLCSCGQPDCVHVPVVEAALVDAEAARGGDGA